MIGIFIGSFNPPTLAHLNIALLLQERYSKIIFVPVNSKYKQLIDIHDRIDMLNIYKKKYNFLEIDNLMENYSYLNYRIIDLLKKKYQNIEIIMGSDLLDKIDTFENYEYLLKTFQFVVITRMKLDTKNIILKKYAKYKKKFKIIEYNSDISSTKARRMIKEKKDTKDILDKDVYLYIKNKHIYF